MLTTDVNPMLSLPSMTLVIAVVTHALGLGPCEG